MKICSRNYKIYFDPKNRGACFGTVGVDGHEDKGGGIILGTKVDSVEFVAGNLIHEIIEGILAEDDRRWEHCSYGADSTRKMFVFDHDYLCEFQNKVLDALLTSGFFRLVDGRPKKRKKK